MVSPVSGTTCRKGCRTVLTDCRLPAVRMMLTVLICRTLPAVEDSVVITTIIMAAVVRCPDHRDQGGHREFRDFQVRRARRDFRAPEARRERPVRREYKVIRARRGFRAQEGFREQPARRGKGG